MAPKTAENFRALCTGEYLISFYPFKIFYSWITVGQANVFLFFDMHFSVSHLMILFSGERGVGPRTGKPLHYKGSFFHRILKGSIAEVYYHSPTFVISKVLLQFL